VGNVVLYVLGLKTGQTAFCSMRGGNGGMVDVRVGDKQNNQAESCYQVHQPVLLKYTQLLGLSRSALYARS
jgi:hypothetical protein